MEDVIGHVVEKKTENKLIIQNYECETFVIEIPDVFHYSVGDAVAEGHDFSRKCGTCKNEQLYDAREEEWYCPVNHDN